MLWWLPLAMTVNQTIPGSGRHCLYKFAVGPLENASWVSQNCFKGKPKGTNPLKCAHPTLKLDSQANGKTHILGCGPRTKDVPRRHHHGRCRLLLLAWDGLCTSLGAFSMIPALCMLGGPVTSNLTSLGMPRVDAWQQGKACFVSHASSEARAS